MPTIEVAANRLGPGARADVPEGGRLLDVCDDARAPVAFSCRSASCGTCRVDVIAGAEHLAPPSADELEVLALFEAAATVRLACQASVLPGPGVIQLAWVDD